MYSIRRREYGRQRERVFLLEVELCQEFKSFLELPAFNSAEESYFWLMLVFFVDARFEWKLLAGAQRGVFFFLILVGRSSLRVFLYIFSTVKYVTCNITEIFSSVFLDIEEM